MRKNYSEWWREKENNQGKELKQEGKKVGRRNEAREIKTDLKTEERS